MTVIWNGKKLIELMARNEENVAELYEAIAESANRGKGEKFFQIFAEDERRHQDIYLSLLNRVGEDSSLEVEIEEEDAKYMDLLLQDNIMKDKDELLKKAKTIYTKEDIYNIAEMLERETVLYVTEIIRLFPNLAPEEMDIVLKEEKRHLKKVLEKKYDYAQSTKGL